MTTECTVRQKPELHNPSASSDTYASFLWELLINLLAALISELSQNSTAQADCHLLLHPHKISLVSELVPFPRLGPRKTRTCSWVIGRKIPSASRNHIQFLLLKPLGHPGFTRWTFLGFMTHSSAEANI